MVRTILYPDISKSYVQGKGVKLDVRGDRSSDIDHLTYLVNLVTSRLVCTKHLMCAPTRYYYNSGYGYHGDM